MYSVIENSQFNNKRIKVGTKSSFVTFLSVLTFLVISDSLISIYVAIIPKLLRYAVLFVCGISAVIYITLNRKIKCLVVNLAPALIYAMMSVFKILISGNFSNGFWSPLKLLVDAFSLLLTILLVHVMLLLPNEYKKNIMICFLIFGSVTVIPSLIYVQSYPDAVRDVYEGFANVGFQYIYAVIAIIVLSFYMLKSKNANNKKHIFVFFAMNLLIIIFANFATAFVCTFLGIILMLLCTRKSRFKSIVVLLVMLMLLLFLLRPVIAQICYLVSKADIFSAIMKKRIASIGDFLTGKGGGSSFGSRFALMERSYKTFINNPIFGINFAEFNSATIGFHETWITMLASTGLVGTAMYCITIGLLIKTILKNIKVKNFAVAYKVMLLVYLFMSFLNPLTFRDVLTALFVISPMFELFFKRAFGSRKIKKGTAI